MEASFQPRNNISVLQRSDERIIRVLKALFQIAFSENILQIKEDLEDEVSSVHEIVKMLNVLQAMEMASPCGRRSSSRAL